MEFKIILVLTAVTNRKKKENSRTIKSFELHLNQFKTELTRTILFRKHKTVPIFFAGKDIACSDTNISIITTGIIEYTTII